MRAFNTKFYEALEAKRESYVLLVDFAKAFDSVGTDYLLALLEKVGIPAWARNLVSALYHNIRAVPILFEGHEIFLKLADGLKQGCPLSPIFFALVVDPLLVDLGSICGLDREAFADDLGLGFAQPGTLTQAVTVIERFTEASGVCTNTAKTVLLCTVGDGTETLNPLEGKWKSVKASEFERYLGTFIGRETNVNNVFDGAWDKLTKRLRRYHAYKSFFSLQGRVDIANSFLISLFSFLFRFYMMTETFMYDVERAIARWVIPNSRYQYEHLTTARNGVGIHRPLKDLFCLNVATLLRKVSDTGFQTPINMASCLMSKHRQIAACYFDHLCGVPAPVDADQ